VSASQERAKPTVQKHFMLKKKREAAVIPVIKETNETSFADDIKPDHKRAGNGS
jgi:hypothetical protein